MAFKPNFNSNANWQLISNGNIQANTFTVNEQLKHDPIPPININGTFTNRAIAVNAFTNQFDRASWTFGGVCDVRLISAQFADYPVIKTVKLIKSQTVIITIPYADNGFDIRLTPPSWFWNFNYNIYGYIGDGYPDNSQKLDEIANLIINP